MDQAIAALEKLRVEDPGKTIVLAFGTFDLLHVGHIKYLEWAKMQGDILVVTLKSNEQVRAHKGPGRPVQNEAEPRGHRRGTQAS